METKEFIKFKLNIEGLSISSLIDKHPSLFEQKEQDQSDDAKTNNILMQKSDIFWMLLEKKIRNTFIVKGNISNYTNYEKTPSFENIIGIKTPKIPPYSVIRTLANICRSNKDYMKLAEKYPVSLKLKYQNGDSLLHRVIAMGGYKAKKFINEIICNTMMLNYNFAEKGGGGEELMGDKFGNLTVKNETGITPLTMLYGLVVYQAERDSNHERWIWFKMLIRRVVHIQSHYCNNNSLQDIDKSIYCNETCFSRELNKKTPLLHAALEMCCPIGLMHRILGACGTHELIEHDSFGRIPLVVALSKKDTAAEVVIYLFRRTPVKVLQLLNMDKEGDLPLHRILKAGTKYHSKSENEITLVGTVVEANPQALHTLDDIHAMPPFMLACIDNLWSLDVIYGLLRTAPGVLEPHVKKLM
jgi:hypothetical protein